FTVLLRFVCFTLLQMAGSGKGKCKKSKGKSKYNKSEIINKKIGTSETNPNLQEKQSNISGSSQEYRDGSSPSHSNLSGEPSRLSCYNEVKIEKLLCERLLVRYNEALELLVGSGFSMDIALKAILNFGCVFGPMNILANIMTNSVVYIYCSHLANNDVCIENGPVFENMIELTKFSLQSLVDEILKLRPLWKKVDAMLYILSSSMLTGTIENLFPTANDLDLGIKSELSEIHSKAVSEGPVQLQNVDHSFAPLVWGSHLREAFAPLAVGNDLITAASWIHPEVIRASSTPSEGLDLLFSSCCYESNLEEWLQSCSSDQKNEIIFSMHNRIEDFKEQLNKQENWSNEEIIKATEKLNSYLVGLRMSIMEKMAEDQSRTNLQLQNFEISSKFASDSTRFLQLAEERHKISLTTIADLEKRISTLKMEMKELKEKNFRLELELVLAEIAQKQPEAGGSVSAGAKKKHG
ncbi:hypothetical protein ACH5RR_000531, partial [Cinchona calisaya]